MIATWARRVPRRGGGIQQKGTPMYISHETIISASALIAALATLAAYYNRAYRWYRRQQMQDEDIKSLKAEQSLLTYGVLACLQGLKEQGCNGPVTEAINKIEKHLNLQAHR